GPRHRPRVHRRRRARRDHRPGGPPPPSPAVAEAGRGRPRAAPSGRCWRRGRRSRVPPVRAIVIYESLTGNTRRAAEVIAAELQAAGHQAVACPTTAVDYQALQEADVVIVGGWTDGFVLFGQRPGRAGRLRKLPTLVGKRAVCYVTYAMNAGK